MVEVDATNAGEAARAVKYGEHLPGPTTVRRSHTIGKLAVALAKAQGELRNPPKDSVNPHFKSRYADLATVRDAVMPVFARSGLSVVQLLCEYEDVPALMTVLMHGESGEFYESTIKLRPGKLDPQGVGSALTYLRRYSLQALAGVAADDDDDGNAASAPVQRQTAQQQQQKPPSPVQQQQASKPAASGYKYAGNDNKHTRAQLAQRYAEAATVEAVGKTDDAVVYELANGMLSEEDHKALRQVRADTMKRFPAKG